MALGSTPCMSKADLRCTAPPRRLSFSPASPGLAAADNLGVQVGTQVEDDVGTTLVQELGLSIQIHSDRCDSSSPVQTPFAVPLPQHLLLPASTSRDGDAPLLGPRTASETLFQGLATSPQPSVLGPRPAASAPARRRKPLPPNFTPRRSARLCKNNTGHNTGPVQRAQAVLLRRMGVIQAEEQLSEEALDEYLKLFDKPLAPHHVKAIAAIFAPDEADFDEPPQAGFGAFSLPEAVEPCGA